jgi:signal transduction histidine kinase
VGVSERAKGRSGERTKKKDFVAMQTDSNINPVGERAVPAELLLGAGGIVESLNPAAEELLGRRACDIVGHSICNVMMALPVQARRRVAETSNPLSHAAAVGKSSSSAGQPRDPVSSLFAYVENTRSGKHVTTLHERRHSGIEVACAPSRDLMETVNRCLIAQNELLLQSWVNVPLKEQLERALQVILKFPGLPAEKYGVILLVDQDGKRASRAACGGSPGCERTAPGVRRCGDAATAEDISFANFLDPDCPVLPECVTGKNHYILPLLNNERLLGIFALAVPSGHARGWADQEFLLVAAGTLAVLIERHRVEEQNLRLLDENRRLNRRLLNILEEEQRRIARELHDDMGQSLTAIRANATHIVNNCETSSSPICHSAKAILASADHLYGLTHVQIRKLRPSALDDLGLVAALGSCVREWRTLRPGIPCSFTADGDLEDLGEEINITLYRIVQECLTNVVRHAAASRVDILLGRSHDEVCLEVRDNGRGMAQAAIGANGRFGLLGIRERVEGLGGRLVLSNRIGQGLSITAYVPVGLSGQ